MAEDDTPIAWLALKEGTSIVASDGSEIGKVTNVVADLQEDIFSGITFRPGILESERFIPAEAIDALTESAVHLTISARDVERLEPYPG